MTNNPYELTIADIRQIVAESGISHAEFCIGQTESQLGSEYTKPLKAELDRLERLEWEDAPSDWSPEWDDE